MADDILAILKTHTARDMAHKTNRLSLIRTRAKTACLTPPSLDKQMITTSGIRFRTPKMYTKYANKMKFCSPWRFRVLQRSLNQECASQIHHQEKYTDAQEEQPKRNPVERMTKNDTIANVSSVKATNCDLVKDLLIFGELRRILGFSFEHHLVKEKNTNMLKMSPSYR